MRVGIFRRLFWPYVALLGAYLPCLSHAQTDESLSEIQVKAGFLYNFIKFVEWPSLGASQPLTLCIAGEDIFGNLLDAFPGKPINAHPIKIVRNVPAHKIVGCQVVYISQDAIATEIVREASQYPVLTVSDVPRFLEKGGIIQLETQDEKVIFTINAGAATKAKLQISSKLLALAARK